MADGPGPSSHYHSLLSQALVDQFSQPSTQSFAVRHPFSPSQLVVDNASVPNPPPSLLQTAFTPALAEPKRKPGRPKGSIARKRPLDEENGPWDHSPAVQKRPHLSPTTPSPILEQASVDVHSGVPTAGLAVDARVYDQDAAKRFYEFQWRALSLCSEFYSAAAELIRTTPAVVLAQSLQLGNRADPLKILAEAKRTCDLLVSRPPTCKTLPDTTTQLATPSSLTGGPLPPPYTSILPADYQDTPPATHQPTPIPQLVHVYPSFQTMKTPPHSPAQTNIPPSHSQFNAPAQSQLAMPTSNLLPPTTKTSNKPTFNIRQPTQASHGVWKEEEIAKLQALAEKSKSRNETGEVDWDWVIETFGETRTRHQILIKATGLNLKPTSTHPSRARKRRDTIDAGSATTAPLEPTLNPIHPTPMAPPTPVLSPVVAAAVQAPIYQPSSVHDSSHSVSMLPNRPIYPQTFQYRALPAAPPPSFPFPHPTQPLLDHQHQQQQHHPSSLVSSIPNHYSPPQHSPHIQHPALQQRPQAPNLSPQTASPLPNVYSPTHHHPGPPDYPYSPPHYPVTQPPSAANGMDPVHPYSMGPYMNNGSYPQDGSSG